MDEQVNIQEVKFNTNLQSFVIIIFIIFLLYFVFLQVKGDGFEILIVLSIPILSYIIYDYFNTITSIMDKDGFIVLKKKAKTHSLKNISLIDITYVSLFNSVVMKFKLESGNSIIGFLPYTKVEFENLIALLNKNKINYKERKKLIKIF